MERARHSELAVLDDAARGEVIGGGEYEDAGRAHDLALLGPRGIDAQPPGARVLNPWDRSRGQVDGRAPCRIRRSDRSLAAVRRRQAQRWRRRTVEEGRRRRPSDRRAADHPAAIGRQGELICRLPDDADLEPAAGDHPAVDERLERIIAERRAIERQGGEEGPSRLGRRPGPDEGRRIGGLRGTGRDEPELDVRRDRAVISSSQVPPGFDPVGRPEERPIGQQQRPVGRVRRAERFPPLAAVDFSARRHLERDEHDAAVRRPHDEKWRVGRDIAFAGLRRGHECVRCGPVHDPGRIGPAEDRATRNRRRGALDRAVRDDVVHPDDRPIGQDGHPRRDGRDLQERMRRSGAGDLGDVPAGPERRGKTDDPIR